MLKACIGLNCARQIDFIDRRHCNLTVIPDDIYRHERTLEELLLDYNALQDLPPKLFCLTNLRKLTISENDLNRIPPGIANLTRLVELDLSKNAIEDIPQNIQFCRSLALFDISSNPLLRTPETISTIPSLTQLCLNDVAIPRLPTDIGNLKNLAVLEARENALKSLPASIGALKKLRRLDVGNNEIEFLPSELGELEELTELWLDSNCLYELPESSSKLLNLAVMDVTKNKLEHLPEHLSRLTLLSDLHASENCIEALPDDIGELKALTLLKLDFNHLTELPESIGKLQLVTELLLFDNMLESLPASLFQMSSLEMLNVDRNHLMEIPATVGQCKSLHVLSLRENELLELPEEIGQLEELTVLDVVGNRLNYLPLSLGSLHLDALWIDGSQPQPLIALHVESDPNNPEKKRLTCSFLPQQGPHSPSLENFLEGSETLSEERSITNSLNRGGSLGKGSRLGVAFDPALGPGDTESSKFVRFPTPFRRDMKAKRKKTKHYKPDAIPSTTIFKKGSSADDLTLLSTSSTGDQDTLQRGTAMDLDQKTPDREVKEAEESSLVAGSQQNGEVKPQESAVAFNEAQSTTQEKDSLTASEDTGERLTSVVKTSEVADLVQEEEVTKMNLFEIAPMEQAPLETTPTLITNALYADESSNLQGSSQLQTIEVTVELTKVPGRTLGFSIAGGRGSTPAYEDVDQSIFITRIAQEGLAEQDGRLRLGDKLISVNEQDMTNATHAEAVAALKNVTDVCLIVVSREVLVVMPDDDDQSKVESPSELLPTPKAKLTFSPLPEETEGESFAKKIVSEILGRSVERFRDSLIEGETTQDDDESKVEPSEEEKGEMNKSPHDNYVNYDIAQTVLESTARRKSPSPAAEDEETPLPHRDHASENTPAPEILEPALPLVTSTPIASDGLEERVILDRSIGILGLSIVGGVDHASRVFGQGKPGVYISKITKGGAAHATDKLRLGDHILEVNGRDVRQATHQQAVQWLVSQQGDIELVVRHVPQPPGLKEVVILKRPNEKLGISIRGGSKGSKGNPLDADDEGIFISKITSGGATERDGRLQVGYRILEVNGVSLLGASHIEAVKALRSCSEKLTIIVCNGYDPKEVLRRKIEAEQAANFRSLNDSIHRLLSESVDVLPQTQRSSTLPLKKLDSSGLKLSRSSTDINEKPVTAEDLDKVLKGLAKFRELEISKPPPEIQEPPVDVLSPLPSITVTTSDNFPLQEDMLVTGPLQEDQPDTPAKVEDDQPAKVEDDQLAKVEDDQPATSRARSPSLDLELSRIEEEDTSSLLAALDDELSHMQDEVSMQETELQQADEQEEVEPKPKTVKLIKKPSAAKLGVVSPETRRRAEEIKIKIDPPAGHRASAEAVKSIIGEVFDDVSFEEFEEDSNVSGTASGGILTPTTEALRSMSPDPNSANFQELLSALQGLGEEKKSDEPDKKSEEPQQVRVQVEEVQVKTETKEESVAPTGSPVMLRVSTAHSRDPQRRKSAPPKVADKPSHLIDPEKLSFQAKITMYKKVAQDEAAHMFVPRQAGAKPSASAKESPNAKELGSKQTMATVPPVQRSPSDGAVQPSGMDKHTEESVPISARIALFQASQAKAGMSPVGVRTPASLSENSRLSAEERRLARVMNLTSGDNKKPNSSNGPTKTDSESDPSHCVKLEVQMKHQPSQSPTLTEDDGQSNSNANNSTLLKTLPSKAVQQQHMETSVDPYKHETSVDSVTLPQDNNTTKSDESTVSPYVAQVLANMPDVVQPPQDEELNKDNGEEWEKRRAWRENKEVLLQEQVNRVEAVLKEARSSQEQSELQNENSSASTEVENHVQ